MITTINEFKEYEQFKKFKHIYENMLKHTNLTLTITFNDTEDMDTFVSVYNAEPTASSTCNIIINSVQQFAEILNDLSNMYGINRFRFNSVNKVQFKIQPTGNIRYTLFNGPHLIRENETESIEELYERLRNFLKI